MAFIHDHQAFDTLRPWMKAASAKSTLSFFLNGTKIDLENPNPDWTLLDFVRSQHGLTGTKLGCGEGGCGYAQ
jgi:xanthine dehydrogenase/oxidase